MLTISRVSGKKEKKNKMRRVANKQMRFTSS